MLLALPGIPCLCPYLRILTLGMLMTTELDLDTQVIEMCEWPPFCQNAIDFFTLVCLLPNCSEAWTLGIRPRLGDAQSRDQQQGSGCFVVLLLLVMVSKPAAQHVF